MAKLTLNNQRQASNAVKTRTDDLKTLLDSRRAIWEKLPFEQKRVWIRDGKDPVMSLAWEVYDFLDQNFFGREHHHPGEDF